MNFIIPITYLLLLDKMDLSVSSPILIRRRLKEGLYQQPNTGSFFPFVENEG